MERFERSTVQQMGILNWNEEKDTISNLKYTSKIHSTLQVKKFNPLYTETFTF